MEQHETEAALLPNIANQMRSLLSNLYLAASQVIPPEQREQDPAALLLFAAFLFCQSQEIENKPDRKVTVERAFGGVV